jgi:hypothetical protein
VQNDIKSFVLLKYEILSSNSGTWDLCKTYPIEVQRKWAWRCVEDAEYLVIGYPKSQECIRLAKAYRDGTATKEELDEAYDMAMQDSNIGFWIANSSYHAAHVSLAYHSNSAHGVCSVHYATIGVDYPEEKWKLYIDWLIEELCEWELKQIS